jgi:hypothetical protein
MKKEILEKDKELDKMRAADMFGTRRNINENQLRIELEYKIIINSKIFKEKSCLNTMKPRTSVQLRIVKFTNLNEN